MSSACDKCGTEVPAINDAVNLDFIITGNPLLGFAYSRHLLPVIIDGVTVCAGSPSRAQYIEGQPRDARGMYGYTSEQETKVREAYATMLETAPTP